MPSRAHRLSQRDDVRIDVDDRRRARRRSGSATASPSGCRRCSTRTASARAASSSRARSSGACTAPQLQRVARRRRADPHSRRRALQEPAVGLAHLRSAHPRGRRSRQRDRRRRRRRRSATRPDSRPPRSCAASRSSHVPTTLLAQVDSSIGGKVGVNHALGKNLIGAFHQPAVVVIDPLAAEHAAAARVPLGPVRGRQVRHDREPRRCSIASRATPRRSSRAIPTCSCRPSSSRAASRRTSCPQDERESGLRRILNFGHTVGHALEAVTKYRRFRHGEAIALRHAGGRRSRRGARRARRARASGAGAAHRAARAAAAGRRLCRSPRSSRPIRRDKKVVDGRLHFVLAIDIGATMTVDDVTEDELRAVLTRTRTDSPSRSRRVVRPA